MSTKSVLLAVLLISLGIVFGVVLVSSFRGVDVSFAGEDVRLQSQDPPVKSNATLKALNEAFHEVSHAVTPTVVYVTVEMSGRSESDDSEQPFYHFFGPDFKFQIPKRGPEIGSGSGVILTKNGYILTNNHVVDGAKKDGIRVRLLDTREFKAKLIGTDKYTDIAVIKIDADDLSAASLGNSDDVEVGHMVFAFGNPLGLTSTMTMGVVSAVGRQIRIIDDENTGYGIENFIQTDAAVNPGNSGGALVDIGGQVIGINTAIATTNARYQGYSFAIPINLARKVAEDLIHYGKVRRGYIGVRIEAVDAVTAKAAGLDHAEGVMVRDVNRNSAGEAAGIQVGDIILSVDGKTVNTPNALQSTIAGYSPGQTVTLKIWRDKSAMDTRVTLKALAEEESTAANEGTEQKEQENVPPESPSVAIDALGMSVKALDAKAKKLYDVEKGVLIDSLDPMGPAAERGLAEGDVIVGISGKSVSTPDQFASAIKKLKPGDAVMLRVKGEDKRIRFTAVEIPK